MRCLAPLLSLPLLFTAAPGSTVVQTDEMGWTYNTLASFDDYEFNYDEELLFRKFNPDLGALVSVEVRIEHGTRYHWGAVADASPAAFSLSEITDELKLETINASGAVVEVARSTTLFDDPQPLALPAGTSYLGPVETERNESITEHRANLEDWTGRGRMFIHVSGDSSFDMRLQGDSWLFSVILRSNARVTITYTYRRG